MEGEKLLVEPEDIQNAIGIRGLGGEKVSQWILNLLKLDTVNEIYQRCYDNDPIEFIDEVFRQMNIQIKTSEEDLRFIPREGPFIISSNHPFGGIDGLVMLKIISQVRPDFKIMVNFMLQRVEPLKGSIIPVNPFQNYKDRWSSLSGIKMVKEHLNIGYGIGIFPAGEVSSYQADSRKVTDGPWQKGAIKLIQKAQVPVIPMWFEGSNSTIFNVLGTIHPMLRTLQLPSEQLKKSNQVVNVRIGKPIKVQEQERFKKVQDFGKFLRARTYILGASKNKQTKLQLSNFFHKRFKIRKHPDAIIPPVEKELLVKEINDLKPSHLMLTHRDCKVYVLRAIDAPLMVQEIGRLREETFRKVGEGTNQNVDLDEFDLHYEHLVLWNDSKQEIMGAYRIGKGKEILAQYGKRGFYLSTLFRLKSSFRPILNESLELGRSFIVEQYQRQPQSLLLLWKGIMAYWDTHPEYRYLIGPVSISDNMSKFSKSLLVDFIRSNYFDRDLAKKVKAKHKFRIENQFEAERETLLLGSEGKLKHIDIFLDEVERNMKAPILLKRYIDLNAKIIGFNIDPKFNHCLDGFIVLDTNDIPEEVIKRMRS